MKYYTSTRGYYRSPAHKYFDSIEELNKYYGIESKEEDYDKGYSFEYKGHTYFLYSENE